MLFSALSFAAFLAAQDATWHVHTMSESVTFSAPYRLDLLDPHVPRTAYNASSQVWSYHSESCAMTAMFMPRGTQEHKLGPFEGLAKFVEGLKKNVQIEDGKAILVNGWPGISVRGRSADGILMAAHLVSFGDHLVILSANCPGGDKQPSFVDPFLGSLKFPKEGPFKKPGPELTRFDLGNTGVSALFPLQPSSSQKIVSEKYPDAKASTFIATYGLTAFEVVVIPMPAQAPNPTAKERLEGIKDITSAFIEDPELKATKKGAFAVGKDVGEITQVEGGGVSGSIGALMHGRKTILIVQMGTKDFIDPAVLEGFINSLQFKD